jgi:hypothetical protein
LDTYSHAIPATQEEAGLIAELVFARKRHASLAVNFATAASARRRETA